MGSQEVGKVEILRAINILAPQATATSELAPQLPTSTFEKVTPPTTRPIHNHKKFTMGSPKFSDDEYSDRDDQAERPPSDRDYRQRNDNEPTSTKSNRNRDRSRSPNRPSTTSTPASATQKPKQNFSKSFKWKSKSSSSRDAERTDFREKYRDRDPEYQPKRYGGRTDGERLVDRERGREERDRDRNRDRRDYGRRQVDYHDDSYRRGRDRRDENDDRSREDRHGGRRDEGRRRGDKPVEEKDKRRDAPPAAIPGASQEYIVVTVNDRLGTKARIPCLPSDTIGKYRLPSCPF
jgi:hypothetical protein